MKCRQVAASVQEGAVPLTPSALCRQVCLDGVDLCQKIGQAPGRPTFCSSVDIGGSR